MANTPSAIKRIRQGARRAGFNAPRRTAAKTYVAKALRAVTGATPEDAAQALAEAISALDRAARSGAIHPNAAARRKSRLALKMNAALGGVAVETGPRAKTTGKAAATKAARARVAASKARAAEAGPKTAAGKARAAMAKTATSAKTAGKPPAATGATTAKAGAAPKRATTKKASPARERSS